MGFLFLIVIGILAMILVARLASKTKEEDVVKPVSRYDSNKADIALQKGLIALLLKKNIINEEELLTEINRIKNDPSLN